MAAVMAPPTPSSAQSQPIVPNPSRSPLPLSASQEAQVRELYYKRVRTKCADEVRDFASCCQSQPFTATFMCRAQQKAMNKCMNAYATQEEKDAARAEWFATIDKRKEEREKKEAKRVEDEKFWKQWWDKDAKELPPVEGRDAKGRKQ